MRGTIQFARISGIPLRIHWSFILIIIWIIFISIGSGLSLGQLIFIIGIICCVFTIITLHELGHGFAASYFKVKTKDILLSPIGGLARFERIPEKPFQEFAISIAGPVVNLFIASLFLLSDILFSENRFTIQAGFWRLEGEPNFMRYLFQINLVLLCLNILPIFPLDGGRILRSILGLWIRRDKATFIAILSGIACSLLMMGYGFTIGDEVLGIIGFFVLGGAITQIRKVKPFK